jgi:hypothetical protein
MSDPSLFSTLVVPGQGSCTSGFGFCDWSLFVHEVQPRTHVVKSIAHPVQVAA